MTATARHLQALGVRVVEDAAPEVVDRIGGHDTLRNVHTTHAWTDSWWTHNRDAVFDTILENMPTALSTVAPEEADEIAHTAMLAWAALRDKWRPADDDPEPHLNVITVASLAGKCILHRALEVPPAPAPTPPPPPPQPTPQVLLRARVESAPPRRVKQRMVVFQYDFEDAAGRVIVDRGDYGVVLEEKFWRHPLIQITNAKGQTIELRVPRKYIARVP